MRPSRMSSGEIVRAAISRNATTGFLSFSGSTVMGDPLAIVRARCAATSTSSNLLDILSMQSSTVTRAMRSFLHCEVSAGRCSNLLELHGSLSPAFRIVLQNKAHPVAFVQHANASGLERTRVNECVLATLIKLNKSKSFRCVEELHGPVHGGRLRYALRDWRGASPILYHIKSSEAQGLQITSVHDHHSSFFELVPLVFGTRNLLDCISVLIEA